MGLDVTYRRGARLRVLMVLIVLLAAVPIFALHLVRLQVNSGLAVQRAYNDAAILANSGVGAHADTIKQARQLLEVLSRIPAVRSAALPECEEILRSVQEGREWLTGIFVVNTEGKGVCGGSSVVRTLNVSDRDYFRSAKATKEYRVSDVIISRVTGGPIVAGVLPLLNARGEFQGALGVGVSLSWINKLASDANAEVGGLLIASDRAGKIIAYQPGLPQDMTLRQLSGSAEIRDILNSPVPTFEAKDPSGVQRLFSVARLPNSGITVAVGLDRNDVLSPIERGLRADLLFLLFVTALSIGLAWFTAELGLMRGVRALKVAAQRLKAGKMGLRVRLPPSAAAELHDLAATYNAMTAEFERLAYLDRLTGLPNRRYLERHLAKRDSRETPAGAVHNAVLAIDIDGFKPVNDSHGHAIGDRVLAIIARRIAGAVDERGLLFRVGGDEFVAIIPLAKTQGRETAREIGEDIRQSMEQPIEFDDLIFPIACSVGIALVPEDTATLSHALVVADAALYEAKRTGRNRVVENAPPLVDDLPDPDPRTLQYSPSRMELG